MWRRMMVFKMLSSTRIEVEGERILQVMNEMSSAQGLSIGKVVFFMGLKCGINLSYRLPALKVFLLTCVKMGMLVKIGDKYVSALFVNGNALLNNLQLPENEQQEPNMQDPVDQQASCNEQLYAKELQEAEKRQKHLDLEPYAADETKHQREYELQQQQTDQVQIATQQHGKLDQCIEHKLDQKINRSKKTKTFKVLETRKSKEAPQCGAKENRKEPPQKKRNMKRKERCPYKRSQQCKKPPKYKGSEEPQCVEQEHDSEPPKNEEVITYNDGYHFSGSPPCVTVCPNKAIKESNECKVLIQYDKSLFYEAMQSHKGIVKSEYGMEKDQGDYQTQVRNEETREAPMLSEYQKQSEEVVLRKQLVEGEEQIQKKKVVQGEVQMQREDQLHGEQSKTMSTCRERNLCRWKWIESEVQEQREKEVHGRAQIQMKKTVKKAEMLQRKKVVKRVGQVQSKIVVKRNAKVQNERSKTRNIYSGRNIYEGDLMQSEGQVQREGKLREEDMQRDEVVTWKVQKYRSRKSARRDRCRESNIWKGVGADIVEVEDRGIKADSAEGETRGTGEDRADGKDRVERKDRIKDADRAESIDGPKGADRGTEADTREGVDRGTDVYSETCADRAGMR